MRAWPISGLQGKGGNGGAADSRGEALAASHGKLHLMPNYADAEPVALAARQLDQPGFGHTSVLVGGSLGLWQRHQPGAVRRACMLDVGDQPAQLHFTEAANAPPEYTWAGSRRSRLGRPCRCPRGSDDERCPSSPSWPRSPVAERRGSKSSSANQPTSARCAGWFDAVQTRECLGRSN